MAMLLFIVTFRHIPGVPFERDGIPARNAPPMTFGITAPGGSG